jgi:P pilus assembly chaperone PapD
MVTSSLSSIGRLGVLKVATLKSLVFLILFLSFSSQVQANLALSKYRLYFDNNNRADSLQLRNAGAVALSYKVDLGLVAMTEEGTLRKIEEDPFSAIGLLRYSPKRGRIEAGGRQALRFSLRKPAGLKDGEYRAVLLISGSPESESDNSLSIRPTLSYSVPIIARHGRLEAATELLEPRLVMRSDTPHIELWQSLEGNRSLFGNFIVSDDKGNELGVLNNSAVYLPLKRRKVNIALNKMVKGKVIIEYKEIAKFGGDLAAKTEIELN